MRFAYILSIPFSPPINFSIVLKKNFNLDPSEYILSVYIYISFMRYIIYTEYIYSASLIYYTKPTFSNYAKYILSVTITIFALFPFIFFTPY